jgi:S-DNA-T family DNA segregation ATPase FtsK/SpoIIIE
LVERCPDCGFVYEDVSVEDIAGVLRSLGPRYRAELAGADIAAARLRPAPDVWSVLEYCCHVRDVLLVQRERAVLALVEDHPSFAPMYRDKRVALARYGADPLAAVAEQLAMAAGLCALVFTELTPEQLARRLVYNYPAPTERDVVWLGRHTVHEGEHHLGDVRAGLDRVAPPTGIPPSTGSRRLFPP